MKFVSKDEGGINKVKAEYSALNRQKGELRDEYLAHESECASHALCLLFLLNFLEQSLYISHQYFIIRTQTQ